MVRLKGHNPNISISVVSLFQFQSGTIKSVGTLEEPMKKYWYFNSKVVRLKAALRVCVSVSSWYFNSKVVRLKAMYKTDGTINVAGFQFQSGTIKRVIRVRFFCPYK